MESLKCTCSIKFYKAHQKSQIHAGLKKGIFIRKENAPTPWLMLPLVLGKNPVNFFNFSRIGSRVKISHYIQPNYISSALLEICLTIKLYVSRSYELHSTGMPEERRSKAVFAFYYNQSNLHVHTKQFGGKKMTLCFCT